MGGHGVHTTPNMSNMQETDEEMQAKIQSIETIKYNPNMFHLSPTDPQAIYTVLGGAPSMACGAGAGLISVAYYQAQARSYNMYSNMMRIQARFVFGAALGLAFGYAKFGDRQRLHNAYIAERIRARYPESMNLNEHDLWRFKDVKAPHAFYRWA